MQTDTVPRSQVLSLWRDALHGAEGLSMLPTALTRLRSTYDPALRDPESAMTVRVTCSLCGHLGSFFVTPTQHLEGAMVRAERLQAGHHCPDDPMRRVPTTVLIQQDAD